MWCASGGDSALAGRLLGFTILGANAWSRCPLASSWKCFQLHAVARYGAEKGDMTHVVLHFMILIWNLPIAPSCITAGWGASLISRQVVWVARLCHVHLILKNLHICFSCGVVLQCASAMVRVGAGACNMLHIACNTICNIQHATTCLQANYR